MTESASSGRFALFGLCRPAISVLAIAANSALSQPRSLQGATHPRSRFHCHGASAGASSDGAVVRPATEACCGMEVTGGEDGSVDGAAVAAAAFDAPGPLGQSSTIDAPSNTPSPLALPATAETAADNITATSRPDLPVGLAAIWPHENTVVAGATLFSARANSAPDVLHDDQIMGESGVENLTEDLPPHALVFAGAHSLPSSPRSDGDAPAAIAAVAAAAAAVVAMPTLAVPELILPAPAGTMSTDDASTSKAIQSQSRQPGNSDATTPAATGLRAPAPKLSLEPTGSSTVVHASPRPRRPVLQRFYSQPQTPTISPARHHFRLPNAAPRLVKHTPSIIYAEDAQGKYINQYLVLGGAGQGSHGKVYRAVDPRSGVQYAVKEYSKAQLIRANRRYLMELRRKRLPWTGRASDLIREEVAIMKRIDHPNLVELHEVLDDEQSDTLYMVIEWCENGTIMPPEREYNGHATPLDEEQSRLYFRDMILGIEYLHSLGITHRDIKADNVLLGADDVLKIADFGVSEMFDTPENDIVRRCAGSPAYWAPELAILSGGGGAMPDAEELSQVSGRRTDIWAMGVTLFYMHHGWLPFEAENLGDLYSAILRRPVAVKSDTSPDLTDLLHRLLDKNARTRISMAELRQHPWVTCQGNDMLLSQAENISGAPGAITEEHLRSAIDKIRQIYTDHDFDWQKLATASLQRDHGWRGAAGTSPETRPRSPQEGHLSDGGTSPRSASPGDLSQGSISLGSSATNGDTATRASSNPPPASPVHDTAMVDKLTRALDEIVRKMRWDQGSRA